MNGCTVKFGLTEEERVLALEYAKELGFTGKFALSHLSKMVMGQVVGLTHNLRGILIPMERSDFALVVRYAVVKGFRGTRSMEKAANFLHKAAFDIMAKYPLSAHQKGEVGINHDTGASDARAVQPEGSEGNL